MMSSIAYCASVIVNRLIQYARKLWTLIGWSGGVAFASVTRSLWQASGALPSKLNYFRVCACFCSAVPAKAWIGLERIYDRLKVIDSDDAFKLKTGAVVARPDHIGLNSTDDR